LSDESNYRYLLFAGKEEVFAAKIDDLWQETRHQHETHLSNLPTLEERVVLCAVFDESAGIVCARRTVRTMALRSSR